MAVRVAEYFGQKTENNPNALFPVFKGNCPFMNDTCVKLSQGNKPVCTVRRNDGSVWIVCRHRLCATKNGIKLTDYQADILFDVAKCIYGSDVLKEDIAVKREATIPVVENSSYHADYIMMNVGPRGKNTGQKKVVLEMQGGGETSNTGSITRNIDKWEKNPNRSNQELATMVSANPIVTNAWRRQQEQFIIKGSIAMKTGGGIVFCVGAPLYDYLWNRVRNENLGDLREHHWTLAIIGFVEGESNSDQPIKFEIDTSKVLFTNYQSFVQALINQGVPNPSMFTGQFDRLNGNTYNTDSSASTPTLFSSSE